MSGFKGTDRFSGDKTATAAMAAGQSSAAEQIPAASFAGNDKRAVIAVTLAGVGAFFNLHATQPLLPLFEQIFHASKAAVGVTVSAATLAVAISAPFWGALAERAGRRRIIVMSIFLLALPTILAATAGDLSQLIFWRFLQGLVMPGVFGVTIAYIAEEWPRHRVPQVISIYVSGTVLGGYLGRIFTGVAATNHLIPFVEPSWRIGFVVIGVFDLVFGILLWRVIRRCRRAPGKRPPSASTSAIRNCSRHSPSDSMCCFPWWPPSPMSPSILPRRLSGSHPRT
jgi:MFS family permease